MKIAMSADGKTLDDNISDFFGRCPYFIFAEIEDGKVAKVEAMKNNNVDQMGGAGLSAAKLMAEKNVDVVIAGNVGPRALDGLKQFNIEVRSASGKVAEILDDFIKKIT